MGWLVVRVPTLEVVSTSLLFLFHGYLDVCSDHGAKHIGDVVPLKDFQQDIWSCGGKSSQFVLLKTSY